MAPMSWHRIAEPFASATLIRPHTPVAQPVLPSAGAATATHELTAPARNLLERLSLLAPDPIPGFLLLVPVPFVPDEDAYAALDELVAHALVTRAAIGNTFRLRGPSYVSATPQRLVETLHWMIAAFAGDPADSRCWPWLGQLVPHAEAAAAHADRIGITEPTGRLVHLVALLLHARSRAPASILH